MARLKHALSQAPVEPVRGVKAATHRMLLGAAMDIIRDSGHIPSVAEAALRCSVSRATAYRYFPSRSALVTAIIDSSLGPVRTLASDNPSGRERVHELFEETFPRFKEFEPQLRAAAQLALEHWGLERAGLLEEEPFRRGHRVRILEHAIAPLAPGLRPAQRDRLHHALSVVYGIESFVILKDIWGLADREVERVALWMADALIDAALRDAAAAAHPRPSAEAASSVPLSAAVPPARAAGLPAAPPPGPPGPPPVSPDGARPGRHPARRSGAWYDAQYNARASIPNHPALLQGWHDASARARRDCKVIEDVAYGDDASERLDLFPAARTGAPVLVHIHGGYWRALDKRDHSFVAPPFVAAGALTVVPNYALCPAVGIEQIVRQLVQALAWVYRHAAKHGGDAGRIVVCGHSAGGHLAAMMLACDWPAVAPDLPGDLVKAAVAVSGLYELEPLRHAPFLAADIGLTRASARRFSPAAMPSPRGSLVTVVGGDESAEFHRQAALIARVWGRAAVIASETPPGRNHLTVLDELVSPSSATHRHALRLLGLGAPVTAPS